MVPYTYNPSIWKMEIGKSDIQGYPQLHSKSKATLGYMRVYLKKEGE